MKGKHCDHRMVQNYEVVGGLGHGMAPDNGNSEGDPRGKRSPNTSPNNQQLQGSKAKEWLDDQWTVKEASKLISLHHGVTAGGEEPNINVKTEAWRQLADIIEQV